jgi:hypothetical protein
MQQSPEKQIQALEIAAIEAKGHLLALEAIIGECLIHVAQKAQNPLSELAELRAIFISRHGQAGRELTAENVANRIGERIFKAARERLSS